ncbi:hypothetical protein [Geomesophilobacter sediminis]|uniref:DinB-like domain-containing protein n=1 Tax=Geomesophilobacter sediminis TaxID=2798584 RepID=A0A8J7INF2_9BACT|nr:hypothetical protein [Geomesophilobacter sediminis]MBJ6724713.1 hypothetical protein [Geomesophilobacter sediminis]
MLRTALKYLAVVTAAVLLTAPPALAHEHMRMTKESPKSVQLRETLRDLWIGHVFWVRNVAYSTRIGDMEAAKVAEQNVVSNARALADSVSPLYGKKASDKLFGLLAGHYGAIKEYMTASYAGNKEGKDAAVEKIKANAIDIATFLSGANPNWPKQTLVSLLFAHGGHHMAQIDEFAAKNYTAEAQTWEAMKNHMYLIADALAGGIVKQFPKKF